MVCNIPRPWKRPQTPADKEIMKQAIYEPLASKEQILTPIYIGGKQYGEVKVHSPEPPRTPLNCPNCCAPVVKTYCEYCGTRFDFMVVKVDGLKKRDEIERFKKAMKGEMSLLYADDKIVAEFSRFHEIAHDLGDSPKLPIQKER